MERIAQFVFDDAFPPKTVSLIEVSSLPEVPGAIETSGKPFVLLIVVDASSVSDDLIRSVGSELLTKGMCYACAWGPESSRVHDNLDLAIIGKNPSESDDDVVMTTWHSEDTLEDAVWFFLNCAWPASSYEMHCSDWIAAVIGNFEWALKVRKALLAEATP